MASRMNSGGSNDLNCIKIDPQTGEKFSFNVDIVAAAPTTTHVHSCTWIISRFIQWRRFCYCTVHYVIVDQWNRSLLKLHTKTQVGRAWCHIVDHDDFLGPCIWFLGDVIHSRSIAWLRGFAKGLRPFRASLAMNMSKANRVMGFLRWKTLK